MHAPMIKSLLVTVVTCLMMTQTLLAKDEIHTGFFSNVAVEGYDTVAYFKEGKAVKGKDAFKTRYKGADWLFSSEENLKEFQSNPEKYRPQYGGYCAWAVSQGYTAGVDPKAWSIFKGRLYLNYNRSIQNRWLSDKENLIRKGNENWPDVLKK